MPYEPDPDVMREDEVFSADEAIANTVPERPNLIDFGEFGVAGPPLPSKGPNFPPDQIPIGFNVSNQPQEHNCYPPAPVHMGGPPPGPVPGAYSVPPNFPAGPSFPPPANFAAPSAPEKPPLGSHSAPVQRPPQASPPGPPTGPPPNYDSVVNNPKPTPAPRMQGPPKRSPDSFPELPEVPSFSPDSNHSDEKNEGGGNDNKDESIDFEDLAKRFEALKKRK